jgi:hypothetical protein
MKAIYHVADRQTYDMINEKWKTVRPRVVAFCGVYNNKTPISEVGDANYLKAFGI